MNGRVFGENDGRLVSEPQRVELVTVGIAVYDRGPEPAWHPDRGLYGPWWRFEAELSDFPALRERGNTAWEAVNRLVAAHRGLLERRWSR